MKFAIEKTVFRKATFVVEADDLDAALDKVMNANVVVDANNSFLSADCRDITEVVAKTNPTFRGLQYIE